MAGDSGLDVALYRLGLYRVGHEVKKMSEVGEGLGVSFTLHRGQNLHSTEHYGEMAGWEREKGGGFRRNWWGNRRKSGRSRREIERDRREMVGEVLVKLMKERKGGSE